MLWRWASWATSGGICRSQGVSAIYLQAQRVTGSVWDRAIRWDPWRMQFDNVEAEHINRAVANLSPILRRIVHRVYVRAPGHMLAEQARALRISRTTLWRRLCEIDSTIARWLREHQTTRAPLLTSLEHPRKNPATVVLSVSRSA